MNYMSGRNHPEDPGVGHADHRGADHAVVARTGAAAAIVATLVYAASGLLHGSVSGRGGAEVLFRHVLDRPHWALINLASLLGVVGWLVTFLAVTQLRAPTDSERARMHLSTLAGRLAVLTLAMGTAIASLQFLVDGHTLPALAAEWAVAPPAQQPRLVAVGDLLHTIVREPVFASEPIFVFGLPFVLIGLAVAGHPAFPSWLGWVGATIATATLLTGITWFLGLTLVPELLLWVLLQPLQWLWLLALGAIMSRPVHPPGS